jgi:oxygen-independent coproporphyrinogen III oxidase
LCPTTRDELTFISTVKTEPFYFCGMNTTLIRKYNVQGPRYTSYPAVPHWTNELNVDTWTQSVQNAFSATNTEMGISLYIHLPFCESLCTYCGCNTRITVNHAVEEPYIQAVLAEWSMYLAQFDTKPQLAELHLGGGTPTFFSPDNLHRLLESIIGDCSLPEGYEFGFEGHPNNTTVEHLKVLRQLGFTRLSLGIQDFDPVVQKAINRMQSVEQVAHVVEEARTLGYDSVNFDIIFGLPFQKESSIKQTLEETFKLRPDRIAFYGYAHVPWKHAGQRRYSEKDLPAGLIKRNLYELGKKMLLDEGYFEIGMDHFALPHDGLYKAAMSNTMHRNFMGYTSRRTQLMIGLGCSSISDSGDAFVQNKKVVEDYISAVSDGVIPIFKGHKLSQSEIVLRKTILEIMCHFKADLNWIDFDAKQALDLLHEFIADGILELDGTHLQVLEQGKPFVRNICMALDPNVVDKGTVSQQFSKIV